MKNPSVILIAALVCVLGAPQARSDDFNKAGRTAFQFVKIGVGARQAGLGEASIASVRDVNAVFWNPANITGIQSAEASFSYARWFADMNYFGAAAGVRWSGVGTFAASYAMLRYGDIQEATIPVVGGSSDSRTGGIFTGHDLMLGLSFSRAFTDQLSIGGTVKLLQEKLWVYTVNQVAFDVGTNYDIGYNGMRLAMSAQNFGSAVKWLDRSNRDEGYDIPLVYRIGLSFDAVRGADGFLNFGEDHHIQMNVEALHTNDFGDRFHAGMEYWFEETIALRGGYRFNYEEGNASFGVGLRRNLGTTAMEIDYAFVSYANLESPHRLTLSLAF